MKCPFCNKNIKPIYEITYIPKKQTRKQKRRGKKKKYKKTYHLIGYKIEQHKQSCQKYLQFKQQSNDLHSR